MGIKSFMRGGGCKNCGGYGGMGTGVSGDDPDMQRTVRQAFGTRAFPKSGRPADMDEIEATFGPDGSIEKGNFARQQNRQNTAMYGESGDDPFVTKSQKGNRKKNIATGNKGASTYLEEGKKQLAESNDPKSPRYLPF